MAESSVGGGEYQWANKKAYCYLNSGRNINDDKIDYSETAMHFFYSECMVQNT